MLVELSSSAQIGLTRSEQLEVALIANSCPIIQGKIEQIEGQRRTVKPEEIYWVNGSKDSAHLRIWSDRLQRAMRIGLCSIQGNFQHLISETERSRSKPQFSDYYDHPHKEVIGKLQDAIARINQNAQQV